MKALRFTFSFVFLLVLVGCSDKSESPNMNVDRYISLLKAGKYDHWELPDFTSKDISKLLSYRNESQLITDFPINMISSYMASEVSLGMYVLWTVESIRARSIGSEFLIGTFPSQNPVVERKENLQFIEQDLQVQKVVADTYFDWWESNKVKDFAEFHQIDPLANTEYRWH
ncbi:hypothetical protein J2X69_002616 [Algoriphagus sp. 4150]|uniref:DUF4943 family protein n=1 Tax=Algoriphagus sp. 4150 TaxID=2817756 RepID=UPI0028676CA2|nr:DUF4943 family protein [Algoriphagus sp. 4150]MDR7130268.1 hypothetical protein [Algoriphagus sp. 4150]